MTEGRPEPNQVQALPDRRALLAGDLRMLIGGRLVEAADGARMATVDPAQAASVAEVPNGAPADVEAAVAAAKAAQPAWADLPMRERQRMLLDVARLLREMSEPLGMLDTIDTGNIYSAMRADAAMAADGIEFQASLAADLSGSVTHLDRNLHYTRRTPFGVVAKLLPFNHPISSLGFALGAPLLTGNCLVLKPSPHTPLSALAFGARLKDLLPPGVVNIVTGENDRVAVPLVTHPDVGRISLTGSVEAGRRIMALAADGLKTLTFELGGKNPLIVFPDAEVEFAVDTGIAGMNFAWQSHSCASTSRILVHSSLYRRFADRLAEKVAAVRVALPTDPAAEMGPISHAAQHRKTLDYVALGQAEGARLMTGGDRPADPALSRGYFLRPAVFDEVTPQMRIAREEIFGPVIAVLPWDDYDEMVAIANDVIYGLTAVILTNDLDTAHRTADRLDVGYVEVNGPVSFAQGSPMGGVKQSGFGRYGSMDELLSYTQTKSVNVVLRQGRGGL